MNPNQHQRNTYLQAIKEAVMDEQTTTATYESPALLELGEFGEDTLGTAGVPIDASANGEQ